MSSNDSGVRIAEFKEYARTLGIQQFPSVLFIPPLLDSITPDRQLTPEETTLIEWCYSTHYIGITTIASIAETAEKPHSPILFICLSQTRYGWLLGGRFGEQITFQPVVHPHQALTQLLPQLINQHFTPTELYSYSMPLSEVSEFLESPQGKKYEEYRSESKYRISIQEYTSTNVHGITSSTGFGLHLEVGENFTIQTSLYLHKNQPYISLDGYTPTKWHNLTGKFLLNTMHTKPAAGY